MPHEVVNCCRQVESHSVEMSSCTGLCRGHTVMPQFFIVVIREKVGTITPECLGNRPLSPEDREASRLFVFHLVLSKEEEEIARFFEHSQKRPARESLANFTPANICFGRRIEIIAQRERARRGGLEEKMIYSMTHKSGELIRRLVSHRRSSQEKESPEFSCKTEFKIFTPALGRLLTIHSDGH